MSKIKNTMSDCHIVEKNFNTSLEDYRLKVLPSVVDNWDELSIDEKQKMSSLNFFCGLHLTVEPVLTGTCIESPPKIL